MRFGTDLSSRFRRVLRMLRGAASTGQRARRNALLRRLSLFDRQPH